MDFEEIGINEVNWVDSAQDGDYWRAIVNAVLNLRISQAMELVNYYYFYCYYYYYYYYYYNFGSAATLT